MRFDRKIEDELIKRFENGDTLAAVALALDRIAHGLDRIGMTTNDQGAIELLAMETRDGLRAVSASLDMAADAGRPAG